MKGHPPQNAPDSPATKPEGEHEAASVVIAKKEGAYHHGHLREALMAAAVSRLAESSSADISIRALAVEAGTSHVAAYRHFASRRHLLAAVGEQGFRLFNSSMPHADDPRLSSMSPTEALAMGSAQYVRFAMANPGYFRAMFHKELPPREDFPELCEQAQAAYHCLMAAVAPVVGAGADCAKICEAATSVWAIVHGFSVLQLEGQFVTPETPEGVDAPAMVTAAVRAWAVGYQSRQK